MLPDHAHLVVAAHRLDIETLANFFKGDATLRLTEEGVHPFQGQKGWKGRVPTCWGRKWWAVYKSDEDALVNAIRYVERNPLKAKLPAQKWGFVLPYPEFCAPKVEGAQE